MKRHTFWLLISLAVAFALGASPAVARVISYAPITPRQAIPAVQKRAARHVLLQEVLTREDCWGGPCPAYTSRLVIHDSRGLEPPRDVTPGGDTAVIAIAAAWEGDDGTLRLMFLGSSDSGYGFHYSRDGGTTWSVASVPGLDEPGSGCLSRVPVPLNGQDIGGPVSGGVSSPIRLGTAEVPFVVLIASSTQPGFWGIRSDGSPIYLSPAWGGAFLGSDADGRNFLVGAHDFARHCSLVGQPHSWKVARLSLTGELQPLLEFPLDLPPGGQEPPWMEGWMTPSGAAFFNIDWGWGLPPEGVRLTSPRSVTLWRDGALFELASSNKDAGSVLFAVPTSDFSGAWIVQRDASATVLLSHTEVGTRESWSDPARPVVEALHVAASGRRLLIQTSRHRDQQDDDITGLALWNVGGPAPSRYDLLVLRKVPPAGFVHLDVDAVAGGTTFLFGSGLLLYHVFQHSWVEGLGQEAGVVRASLEQQLLIPASARIPGLFGADWRTDLVLRNPDPAAVKVTLRFLPNPRTSVPAGDATLTLDPNAITVVPDALGSQFQISQGSGALLLIPEAGRAIEATSRTYTASPTGTYGMSVDAVEPYSAAGPGFLLTFSAGLLGPGFRTNLVATDAFGQGSQLDLLLSTDTSSERPRLSVPVPVNGQTQLTGLADWMGVPTSQSASMSLTPRSGWAAAGLIGIDNRTNDPTWFPPDVLGSMYTEDVIPAVVHAEGANGAQYRTDLFLFSLDEYSRPVWLSVKPWDKDEDEQEVELTLAPGESRVIKDALSTTFGKTGVARLRFSGGSLGGPGVRITSRTYTVQPDGSTYGMQLPPLNAAQTASAGETLEILGPTGGPGFRTNLSLVGLADFNFWAPPFHPPLIAHVTILDDHGRSLDGFDIQVPPRGGVQINDLFRKRGLGDGPKAALIRISPSAGLLCAYATTIDNGTNDPVYFPANLAPQP